MNANHTNKTYAASTQRTSFVAGIMAPICSDLVRVWPHRPGDGCPRVEGPESPGLRPTMRTASLSGQANKTVTIYATLAIIVSRSPVLTLGMLFT